MAYFPDFAEYDYLPRYARPGTKTVGWLERGYHFPTVPPEEYVLSRLWEFCKTSVALTRGCHVCPFCENPGGIDVEKDGLCLLLGTGEIRVFSTQGQIYAAPTLIYHYVAAHHYQPPGEFMDALLNGPRPASEEYFALLTALGFEWDNTPVGGRGYVNLREIAEADANIPIGELMARNKRKTDA